MSDQFVLDGSYTATPQGSIQSLDPTVGASISESLSIKSKQYVPVSLSVDTPVSVPFGTVVNAHVVVLKSTAKAKARLTSADGSTQAVPVDGVLILRSDSVPITAIDLTRVPATDTIVRVFLGEKA